MQKDNKFFTKTTEIPLDDQKKKFFTSQFLICLFLGLLGIHKFREKKVLWGIVYLCTVGLLFVGIVYDLVYYGINGFGKSEFERKPTFKCIVPLAIIVLVLCVICGSLIPPLSGKYSAADGSSFVFDQSKKKVTITSEKLSGTYEYKINGSQFILIDGGEEISLSYKDGVENIFGESIYIDGIEYIQSKNLTWNSIPGSDSSLSGVYLDLSGSTWEFRNGKCTVTNNGIKLMEIDYKVADGYLFLKTNDKNFTYQKMTWVGSQVSFGDTLLLKQ